MPITSCVSKQLYNFVQFESLGLYVCYIQRAAGKHKEMAEEQHFFDVCLFFSLPFLERERESETSSTRASISTNLQPWKSLSTYCSSSVINFT